LAFSPAAGAAGGQLQATVGRGALETIQAQRQARQQGAQSQLTQIQVALANQAQAQFSQEQQEQSEFNQTLGRIFALIALDPSLAAFFG
jgi:hypothetical protein